MKQALLWCGSVLFLPVSVLCWMFSLMRNRRAFAQSDVVVINWHMVNFGSGLVAIDVARRTLTGRKVVFVLVWEPSGTQNPLIGKVFQDISVVTIRRVRLTFQFVGRNFSFPDIIIIDKMLEHVTKLFFALVVPGKEFQPYKDVFYSIPVPEDLSDVIPAGYNRSPYGLCNALQRNCLWASLLPQSTSPRPKFPERPRRDIHDRLTSARGGRTVRLCMMYNRVLEGNIHRDGSPITDYIPAIELLIDRGFQVLLAGDQTLDRNHMDSFGGMVADAGKLGVDLDMFRLFAPLESDICIGDAGSGMMLPMIMNLPMLTLNFHPFGVALPGTWVYPKTVCDESGDPVAFQKVLGEDPFGCYTPGGSRHGNWVPEKNTSEDILEAVRCFLEGLDGEAAPEQPTGLEEDIPKISMYHSFGARLSPAFLKRHRSRDQSP